MTSLSYTVDVCKYVDLRNMESIRTSKSITFHRLSPLNTNNPKGGPPKICKGLFMKAFRDSSTRNDARPAARIELGHEKRNRKGIGETKYNTKDIETSTGHNTVAVGRFRLQNHKERYQKFASTTTSWFQATLQRQRGATRFDPGRSIVVGPPERPVTGEQKAAGRLLQASPVFSKIRSSGPPIRVERLGGSYAYLPGFRVNLIYLSQPNEGLASVFARLRWNTSVIRLAFRLIQSRSIVASERGTDQKPGKIVGEQPDLEVRFPGNFRWTDDDDNDDRDVPSVWLTELNLLLSCLVSRSENVKRVSRVGDSDHDDDGGSGQIKAEGRRVLAVLANVTRQDTSVLSTVLVPTILSGCISIPVPHVRTYRSSRSSAPPLRATPNTGLLGSSTVDRFQFSLE
ncbi:hypothetical protein WN55_00029 [Dufourea novaeangliae]|uniref:Uncharacterized protein n=1 Tax=Dufourea novaeangliae TaxID=178035 RepID=A0A154NW95_DUFNO|nr:hypothetical protein WN55_00029 [Dufourea novaeangliae]